MNNIEWKDGAVCYARGKQWFSHVLNTLMDSFNYTEITKIVPLNWLVKQSDFQLNEIREGDFITASELDIEQKYNDVVEVFGLFGFKFGSCATKEKPSEESGFCLSIVDNEIWNASGSALKRQLTYHQIIAIGKLKRMMLEREYAKTQLEKWGEYSGDSNNSESLNSSDQVKNPSHYQLIEGVESIEIIARSMTQEQWKGFCLGNMLKYRIRAGKKDALQQDIDKANFYGELYEMHKEKCYN